jgi:hypothetical protein
MSTATDIGKGQKKFQALATDKEEEEKEEEGKTKETSHQENSKLFLTI